MPPARTTRARQPISSSPSQIDPALHSTGQSPSHPYTLALADTNDDEQMEDQLASTPIGDPLSDFARQVIESVHVNHQDGGDEHEPFLPEDDDIAAAVRAAGALEGESDRELRKRSTSQHSAGGDDNSGPSTGGKRGRQSAAADTPAKKKRSSINGGLVAEESRDLARMKKDSHKEVERKRRDNINEGINLIGRLTPGSSEKLGKGQILKLAAQYLAEVASKEGQPGSSSNGRSTDIQKLQTDLAEAQAQLTEEHARSITLETSWREAEDRAATTQFELERVKKELEDAKMALLENRR